MGDISTRDGLTRCHSGRLDSWLPWALCPLGLIFTGLWLGGLERTASSNASISGVGGRLWDLLNSEMPLPCVTGGLWGTDDKMQIK